MPACARREIVRQGQPGIFHVYSQCVRQAFLLGIDRESGRDYSHRRQGSQGVRGCFLFCGTSEEALQAGRELDTHTFASHARRNLAAGTFFQDS